MNEREHRNRGILFALTAACLFGASTPLTKVLLSSVDPVLMAGLLYLGSGVGLGAFLLLRPHCKTASASEAPLRLGDWPWLAGSVLAGGILAPILLLWGLAATPASSASLLGNLETVFTVSLAWLVFKENTGSRIVLGMGLIVLGGLCLSWTARPEFGFPWRSIAIIGACLGWAIDNNLTRKVSASDPVQIATIKGWVAGAVNIGLGLWLGAQFPTAPKLAAAGVIGFLGYGLSLVVFVLALRSLGTARTSAYFSTAPFVGAAIAIVFLGEPLSPGFLLAAALMAVGVWLHLTEQHRHEHRHDLLEHEHRHQHDDHHQHSHREGDPPGEPHSHRHRHAELTHSHRHDPDLHHRHPH